MFCHLILYHLHIYIVVEGTLWFHEQEQYWTEGPPAICFSVILQLLKYICIIYFFSFIYRLHFNVNDCEELYVDATTRCLPAPHRKTSANP